jgi:hypothetical protein
MNNDHGLDELEHHLRVAGILSAVTGDHGAHPSYRLILEGGIHLIAKPADEANASETWVRNEVAAWVVVRHLGWTSMMGATVHRSIASFQTPGKTTEASLQVLWPHAEDNPAAGSFSDAEIWKAATFDLVTGSQDRGGQNWLGVGPPGEPQELKLIDHGHAFEPAPGGINSAFFGLKKGQNLPDWVSRDLANLADPALDDDLRTLLSPDRLNGVRQRVAKLLSHGVLAYP